MTKVYVVKSDVYEQQHVVGIYATLEGAMEANPAPGTPDGPELRFIPGKQTDPTPYRKREGGWQPDPPGWWNGFDMGWCETITEYDLGP